VRRLGAGDPLCIADHEGSCASRRWIWERMTRSCGDRHRIPCSPASPVETKGTDPERRLESAIDSRPVAARLPITSKNRSR
jgi:hypothetical protein